MYFSPICFSTSLRSLLYLPLWDSCSVLLFDNSLSLISAAHVCMGHPWEYACDPISITPLMTANPPVLAAVNCQLPQRGRDLMYPLLVCAVTLDGDGVCSFFLPSHRFIFLAGSYLACFVHSVFLTSLSFCLHHAPEYIWTLIPQSFLAPKSSTKAVAKMTAPSQQQKPILFFICYWLITYIYIVPTNHSVCLFSLKWSHLNWLCLSYFSI